MNRKETNFSDFICLDCGNIMTLQRKLNHNRKKFHIKDMYCYKCMKITKFAELRDAKYYFKELEFKDNLTLEEQFIYNLIKNDDNLTDEDKINARNLVLKKGGSK